MIEVVELTKVFGAGTSKPTTVLDEIDFTVDSGEIFAVVGPSGAGKSTLARCLNLLERPTSGKVVVNGEDLTALGTSGLRDARRRIGTVFQSSSLLARRTAAENVALPLEYLGATKASTRARVADLLDLVGLADKANLYPHQLSGGQRQRVGIARALALKPSVLLSDEATSGLDPAATDTFLNLLTEVRDELGLAVVFITHEMDTIVRVADTVGRLDHGRIVEHGRLDDLVLDPDSVLGRALRPRGPAARAGADQAAIDVVYNSTSVPADWLTRLGGRLGIPISVLGANVQTVDGIAFGDLTVSVPADHVSAFVDAAAELELSARTTQTPGAATDPADDHDATTNDILTTKEEVAV
ncbi:methionine ABC transporter ATP-binding protein [Gordonia paraffinivorans NBRC 108238]|uniref:Methionine ABC transporter ATP-binding protein n=2 Tax=Gordonia paraffinivorans TaxID=175628 RepID=A0ABQ0ISU1_9ACTN|nr:methionine ABC transporter ATP-binding protein [Gordonia paraffinivorans]GAC85926.1 methionine ABC transporter ATP-binding protein [Gordonia paraffinivorans NBRC 108238]